MRLSGIAPQLTTKEWLAPTVAPFVDRTGDTLFSRAALARDEHRRTGGRDALNDVEDATHSLRVADEIVPAALAEQFRAQLVVLCEERALLERLLNQCTELGSRERLGHEVVCAVLHGLDGGIHIAVSGHHDDLGVRRAPLHEREQIHPVAVGHQQIGEHQGVRLRRIGDGFPCCREPRCEDDVEPLALEEDGEHVAQPRLVVDDENPGLGRRA